MARNGSGTYSLPLADVVAGTTILASWANTTLDDIATALTASIAKDGQTNPTANLPMNNNRHTGVSAATARTDYAQAAQVQDGALQALTSPAGTDTITATAPLSMSAYVTGQRFSFTAAATNTGAVTININSIGAKSITKRGTTALVAGDIQSGERIVIEYDGTRFQLVGAKSGSIGGEIVFSGVISPSQITSNQNNYAPTGIATCAEIRVDSDAARDITGIDATWSDGREVVFTNDGSFTITLKHENASSTAANRFDFGDDSDTEVAAGASVRLRYDGTASRIRLVGGTGSGSGVSDAGGNTIGNENAQTTAGNYTITDAMNLLTAGPFTIASGHTITVGSGENWVIVGT